MWKLLGGAWRRELPFYASIGGNGQRTVDEVCRVVETWLELGPAQVKIRFDADKTARDVDLAGDIAKARAVRTLVGDGLPARVRREQRLLRAGRDPRRPRAGRARLRVVREPVQHYHVESFAKVAAALDIAVSAGEQEYTLQGIKRLIEAGVDIVQPDIVKTGGFTGLGRHGRAGPRLRRRLRAAPDAAVDRPHRQPALRGVADALAPSGRSTTDPIEVQDVVFRTPVRPVKGKFALSDAPGLGLELDETELKKRTIPWTSVGTPEERRYVAHGVDVRRRKRLAFSHMSLRVASSPSTCRHPMTESAWSGKIVSGCG